MKQTPKTKPEPFTSEELEFLAVFKSMTPTERLTVVEYVLAKWDAIRRDIDRQRATYLRYYVPTEKSECDK